MQTVEKPTVVISACLGFEKCRYNGEMFRDEFIEKLQNSVRFIPICPETSIGLSVPREVIRIIQADDKLLLYQPSTNRNLTEAMLSFSNHFVMQLPQVEGFILKCKSPSCAYKDAKHYSGLEKGAHSSKGNGMFTQVLLSHFPLHPFTHDGQLNDYKYREHFLIKLFMLATLHRIIEKKSIKGLMDFHRDNELLMMCYSRQAYKELTAILSEAYSLSFEEISNRYLNRLLKALTKVSRYTSNINTLLLAAANISPNIQHKEKANLTDVIDKYQKGYLPFSVPLYIIKTYAIQYENDKLLQQTLFSPFPDELMELRDSGKIRI